MKLRAIVLGLALLPLGMPSTSIAAANGCPTTPARIAETPHLVLPENSHITAKETAVEIDLGSDGRVRALHLDESSGDGAVDMLTQQTLAAAKFEPPQTGCVASSGALRLAFELPTPEPTAEPAAGASQAANPAAPAPPPGAKSDPNCTPYVHAFITPSPRDRKRTGSATVAVTLDAAGTQTAPPALRKSTGSPVLDAEALRIARTGQYGFELGGPCRPQPLVYALELTFE